MARKRKHHVTRREAQRVCDYAYALCQRLRLPGWSILVMDDPCDDDAHASIRWVEGRHVAQLWLSEGWMELDDRTRRNTITHEVVHLLHSRVSDVAIEDSRHLMHDHEHDDWARRVRREFEFMTDHVATFLADTETLEAAWEAHLEPRKMKA